MPIVFCLLVAIVFFIRTKLTAMSLLMIGAISGHCLFLVIMHLYITSFDNII